MPGPRRITTRVHGIPAPLPPRPRVETGVTSEEKDGPQMASVLTPPRHAHIPELPADGNIAFEGMLFIFSVMSMCMQYINLYKTVWWLPQSHAKYALNFYMIDPYLGAFLVVLMSRRLIWCFVSEVYTTRKKSLLLYGLVQLFKLVVVLAASAVLAWTEYQITIKYSFSYSLSLFYPLVTYVLLFGVKMDPLLKRPLSRGHSQNGENRHTPKHAARLQENDQFIGHNCSMSPEAVRDEVDHLKTDFNYRIKQVLFSSMSVAYYMGFIPLCFAQNVLYYDLWWVSQHVCLIWITAFILFTIHYLPPGYLDILHRCALHLGRWVKVEGRHAHVPYNAWSELQVWQQGALVKHVKGLFKAEGVNNSAEPGNGMHSRFYFLFSRPLRVINWLMILTFGLILVQFLGLVQSTEWSHILTLAFLLFSNYYSLFKLMRDRLVLAKCYKDEVSTPQH